VTDYFFALPWWVSLVGIGLAIGVWMFGNNRTQKNFKLAGVGILLVTIGLTIVSFAIDTPREQGVKRTHAIVSAANSEDWSKFESLLDENTRVGPAKGASKIRQIVEAGWQRGGFKSAKVMSTRSTSVGNLVTVYITIFSEAAYPGRSEWQLDYERRKEGLLLAQAKVTSMDGGNVDMIMSHFRK